MKKYRSEALHIQEPPESEIERLSTKVKAKKKAANMPSKIGRMGIPPFLKNTRLISYRGSPLVFFYFL
ncbi:hypothetical protein KNP414_05376 [Paenibacillus mucilaginosus KNP414]|uniref:Uncharacterized protein n=1 Tax=Paenibacillus mucilaginosus (strain KNP414) TaxID=1036673 RepID=F8FG80_PAEMK|nr:hypothetical protein KNP414_05376 [Paenibacillus mucilaginosus KNP414]